MPGQGNIPLRSVRVPDEEWRAAQQEAKLRGETVSEVVRRALRKYGRGSRGTTGPEVE